LNKGQTRGGGPRIPKAPDIQNRLASPFARYIGWKGVVIAIIAAAKQAESANQTSGGQNHAHASIHDDVLRICNG
jgi:hypothetical protein